MKVWIYLDGRQQGPFEYEQLRTIEGFGPSTKVWFEGLAKWYPAGELEQMAPLFDPNAPAPEQAAQAQAEQAAPARTEASAEQTAATQPQPAPASRRYAPGQNNYRRAVCSEPCPPTYLGLSIFLLICCCSPISLGAVVASICVSTFYGNGNLDKARRASDWAAWLVMISMALGFIPMMLMMMVGA